MAAGTLAGATTAEFPDEFNGDTSALSADVRAGLLGDPCGEVLGLGSEGVGEGRVS